MTNEQLVANVKDTIKKINDRFETINHEWDFNIKTLIALLRGYAANLESVKEKTGEFESYCHVIGCKTSVLDSYNTLHDLFHEKQCLKSILELLTNEEKNKWKN